MLIITSLNLRRRKWSVSPSRPSRCLSSSQGRAQGPGAAPRRPLSLADLGSVTRLRVFTDPGGSPPAKDSVMARALSLRLQSPGAGPRSPGQRQLPAEEQKPDRGLTCQRSLGCLLRRRRGLNVWTRELPQTGLHPEAKLPLSSQLAARKGAPCPTLRGAVSTVIFLSLMKLWVL